MNNSYELEINEIDSLRLDKPYKVIRIEKKPTSNIQTFDLKKILIIINPLYH